MLTILDSKSILSGMSRAISLSDWPTRNKLIFPFAPPISYQCE